MTGPKDPPPQPSAGASPAVGNDADLWARAAAGEGAARAELAQLTTSIARAELLRRGVRGEDLADLAQEVQRTTFAFLSRGPAAPRDLSTFLKYRAWGVLSDHRKKMRASRLDYRDDLEPLLGGGPGSPHGPGGAAPSRPGPGVDHGRGLAREEAAAALVDCRRRLPEELGRTLALRYDEGLDTESIQRRLGVHRNTIHLRVFRALERLRECLTAKGYGSEDLP